MKNSLAQDDTGIISAGVRSESLGNDECKRDAYACGPPGEYICGLEQFTSTAFVNRRDYKTRLQLCLVRRAVRINPFDDHALPRRSTGTSRIFGRDIDRKSVV